MIKSIFFKFYTEPRAKILYHFWKKPKVDDIFATMRQLIDGKSIARFGDGEFDLINGVKEGFQRPDKRLGILLKEVLDSQNENLLVGIPDIFENRLKFLPRAHNHWKWYKVYHFDLLKRLLGENRHFSNSLISRFYSDIDDLDFNRLIKMYRQIWDNKDVYIIEGEKTRIGVGNDLLSNSKSISRILAPAKNAFDKYDDILNKAKELIPTGALIILALGPTATILARDLCNVGYQALDLGHIDIQYEYYIRGTKEKINIPGKFVNEVVGGDKVDDKFLPKEYYSSIIGIV